MSFRRQHYHQIKDCGDKGTNHVVDVLSSNQTLAVPVTIFGFQRGHTCNKTLEMNCISISQHCHETTHIMYGLVVVSGLLLHLKWELFLSSEVHSTVA